MRRPLWKRLRRTRHQRDVGTRLEGPVERSGSERLGPLLVGVAIGMVLLGLVWTIIAGADTAERSSARDSGPRMDAGVRVDDPSDAVPMDRRPTRMERCASAASALSVPLDRAARSLDQWEVHVGAMNKLVVGAITLHQAQSFWAQTRVGAHHRIDLFDQAWAELHRHGVDCPDPRMLGTSASRRLRSCTREVAAEIGALGAARTAIDTWRAHVHDMEMLRTGRMSASTASRMWLMMWQRGVRELDTFRAAAARTTDGSDGCGGRAGAVVQGSAGERAPSTSPSPMGEMG